jgi:serine/threonine protein kinase/Tfp pilus assembly protein PilF
MLTDVPWDLIGDLPMPAKSDPLNHSQLTWRRREEIVEAFEEAWLSGETPRLEDYLPADGPDHRPVLVELVRADLECRFRAGLKPRVEDYLRFADLQRDAGIIIGLVEREWELRKRHEGEVSWEEYARRFPKQCGGFPFRHKTAPEQGVLTIDDLGRQEPKEPKATEVRANASWPTIPKYEIVKKLGQGGMGVVYQAYDPQLDRQVAIKMIKPKDGMSTVEFSRFRSRFQAEAKAVAQLEHLNIIRIYDFGEVNALPFFCMEFVDGESLQDRRESCFPLPAREAALIVEVLARATHFAHEKKIVHSDIKPANILLGLSAVSSQSGNKESNSIVIKKLSDSAFIPKIADFGLAARLDTDTDPAQRSVIAGTPSYMAPEQAKGEAIGPATDVYALGALLYDLLADRPPFKADTTEATLTLVRSNEPIPIRQFQPNVPADLETICLKCLHKKQSNRYVSAEALAEDLRRFLGNIPILARPAAPWEHMYKWAQNHPARAGLILVAFLATVFLVLYLRNEADISQHELLKANAHAEARKRCTEALFRGSNLLDAGRLNEANTELASAREALLAHADLKADDLQAEVEKSLQSVGKKLRQQTENQAARQRLERFHAAYFDALYHHTDLTALETAENRFKTRADARKALTIYSPLEQTDLADHLLAALQQDRPHHEDKEHRWLAGACYELLLILAEIEAEPAEVAESEKQLQIRAEKALALLGHAGKLTQPYQMQTRLHQLLEASCLAQSRGEKWDRKAAEKNLPRQPFNRLDWFLTARDSYRQSRYEESIAACEQILGQQADDFWAHYVKALSQLRLGRWAEAKGELTVCLNLKRDFPFARLLRGFAASEQGARHASKDLANAEFTAAAEDFNSALKQSRTPLIQYVGLTNRGVLNIRQKRWHEAVADLQSAILVNPKGFPGYLNLAQALQGLGNNEPQALEAMNQAVAAAPKLALAYESRARLHLLQKNRDKAKHDFKTAIGLEPKGNRSDRLANNLVELGKLLSRERQYPQALDHYDQALKINPKFVLVQRFRAETLLALDRPDEAGVALDSYISTLKEAAPPHVYQARGLLHAQKKQLSAAIEMYTLALRLGEKTDDAWQTYKHSDTQNYRGWAYLFSDASLLALQDFEACLSQEENADALIGRGSARIRLRQLDGALEDAFAAEKKGELTDRLWYNLARIYAQAAGQLEQEGRSSVAPDRRLAQRLSLCRQRALNALNASLEQIQPKSRSNFWGEQVQVDPAFNAIRREAAYLQLARQFGKK